jgi:hypothetical protein
VTSDSGTLQAIIARLVITGWAEIWMLVVLTATQGLRRRSPSRRW